MLGRRKAGTGPLRRRINFWMGAKKMKWPTASAFAFPVESDYRELPGVSRV